MKRMKKLMKVLKWLFLALLALVFIAYLALLVINFSDEPPSDGAKLLKDLYDNRAVVRDQDNAYIYFLGLSVGPDEDPFEWGLKRQHWYQEEVLRPSPFTGELPVWPGNRYSIREHHEDIFDDYIDYCERLGATCLDALSSGEKEIETWLNENRWVLDRYKKLIKHSRWLEPSPYAYSLPLPDYSYAKQAQFLFYAHIWLVAGSSDVQMVKKMLEEDLSFWRGVVSESDLLITKVVAAYALKRGFAWANVILSRLPPEDIGDALPESLTKPITAQERSMLRAMSGEWVSFARFLKQAKEQEVSGFVSAEDASFIDDVFWLSLVPTLKLQASSNLYASRVVEQQKLLDVPYAEYSAAFTQVHDSAVEDGKGIYQAYNFLGSYLVEIGRIDLSRYSVRVADLEGMRLIAMTSIGLHAQETALEDVPTALQDMEFKNPYTGEPFSWDAETRTIRFRGLGEGERGDFSVYY